MIGDRQLVNRAGHPGASLQIVLMSPVPGIPEYDRIARLVGCSCAALIISFLGVAQFDLPITKYVRSVTIHLPWDQLTVPWMAFTSDTGDGSAKAGA